MHRFNEKNQQSIIDSFDFSVSIRPPIKNPQNIIKNTWKMHEK